MPDRYRPRVPRYAARHEIRGVTYHVNLWGDREAPPLVLLHGWGDAGSTFQFVVDALQDDWFVVAPDWRGFGKSRHRTYGYWFPDYLADLDELLAIYSPDEPARVAGHSMGANILSLYGGVMPERIAKLVNIEGFGLRNSDPAEAPKRYREWIEAQQRNRGYSRYERFEELAQRVNKRSPTLADDRARFVAERWAEVDEEGKVALRADPAHKIRNPVLYRRAEAEACWHAVTAPVLFVIGGNTDFNSPDMLWVDPDHAFGAFPRLTKLTIPGAGHMVHFEQPGALAAAIEEFMLERGGPSTAGDPSTTVR